jgi:hypothetical protein
MDVLSLSAPAKGDTKIKTQNMNHYYFTMLITEKN